MEKGSESLSSIGGGAKVSSIAWNSDSYYIRAIQSVDAKGEFYREYLRQRMVQVNNPAFYFDCADFFFKQNDKQHALRILSNLLEIGYENPSALRAVAWHLRDAGLLDESIKVFRIIAERDVKSSIIWRDLALALSLRAKQKGSPKDAQEALELFKKAAFTPCDRYDAENIAVLALKEFNELADWCERQTWIHPPVIPEINEQFRKSPRRLKSNNSKK